MLLSPSLNTLFILGKKYNFFFFNLENKKICHLGFNYKSLTQSFFEALSSLRELIMCDYPHMHGEIQQFWSGVSWQQHVFIKGSLCVTVYYSVHRWGKSSCFSKPRCGPPLKQRHITVVVSPSPWQHTSLTSIASTLISSVQSAAMHPAYFLF